MTVGLKRGPQGSAGRQGPGAACRHGEGPVTGASRWQRATVLFVGLAAVLVAVEAAAIGLGPATLSSGLGEPLRMSIPVTLQPDEDVGCVQVRPHGDDLPTVYNTRSQVLRSGNRTRIEIQSPASVDEPAIGLVVSVGCASPVARDYVLFLDPPVVAATASADTIPAASPPAATSSTRPPRTRQPFSSPPAAGTDAAAGPPRPARRRAPQPVAAPRVDGPTASISTPKSPTAKSQVPKSPTPPRSAPVRTPSSGDRLSVMPTEPPVIGRTSSSPQSGVYPPAVPGGSPSTPGPVEAASAAPATVAPAVVPAAGAAAAAPTVVASAGALPPTSPPAADVDAQAREEALRQQQALLQSQIKSLGDQIALLRVQTTALAARNQSLEASAFSPTLVWLLIALAVIAIIVAGWMAWRYTQLRRSLEGSAWWTGQTGQDRAGLGDESPGGGVELAALDGVTRSMARPTTRSPTTPAEPRPRSTPVAPVVASSSAQISNIDRVKPAVRAPGSTYPAAMDTDFTVSDIEAAMATVRTVSPARPDKTPDPLEDSDFSGLGGSTITSPFSDEPPTAKTTAGPSVPDEMAEFVDLEIPPTPPLVAVQSPAPTSERSVPRLPGSIDHPLDFPAPSRPMPFEPARSSGVAKGEIQPPATTAPDLDFRFEMPEDFDPLSSDSHKTTLVDRPEPVASDFEMSATPTTLDFELPSQTQILSMTVFDRDAGGKTPRQGASALDDLFAPNGDNAHDTVLDLDDRGGAPLTGTEVDRLTSTETDPSASVVGLSARGRLARVADLMTRIDEIATTDPLRAIASLRQYVLRDEHIPTLMWLRLFELYKIVDKRPVHDALAEHFARRYHRPMVGWTETLADRTPQRALSSLIGLDQEIESQWGTEAGLQQLERLLCERTEDDAIVFNAILQRDLLDAAKIYPEPAHDASGTP